MEREVGGGIGMGNTCKPLAVSFQCMTKSTINKKKKKNKKKKASKLRQKIHHTFIISYRLGKEAGMNATLTSEAS